MYQIHYHLTLHFMENEPVAAARRLELVRSEYAAEIIKAAPLTPAINVIKSMIPSVSAKLFEYFSPAQCLKLTQQMEVADLAAILRHLDKANQQRLIELLPLRKQTLCKMLITYPEYSIGSVVETDVLIADSQMRLDEVLLRLRKRSFSYLQWIYVVNHGRQLQGKVFIGDVLKGDPDSEITDLITHTEEPISATSDMVSAMEWDSWNHTDTLAVCNRKQEFFGVIHFSRLRHFVSVKQAQDNAPSSTSSDLLEIYGDTIVSMVDLMQPVDPRRNEQSD